MVQCVAANVVAVDLIFTRGMNFSFAFSGDEDSMGLSSAIQYTKA